LCLERKSSAQRKRKRKERNTYVSSWLLGIYDLFECWVMSVAERTKKGIAQEGEIDLCEAKNRKNQTDTLQPTQRQTSSAETGKHRARVFLPRASSTHQPGWPKSYENRERKEQKREGPRRILHERNRRKGKGKAGMGFVVIVPFSLWCFFLTTCAWWSTVSRAGHFDFGNFFTIIQENRSP